MVGLDTLKSIRRSGFKPAAGVQIVVTEKRSLHDRRYVEWLNDPESPGCSMVVKPSAAFDRIDLRYVVGLRVLVRADADEQQQRAIRAMCLACVDAGATEVIGVQAHPYPRESEWFKGEKLPDRGELVFHVGGE